MGPQEAAAEGSFSGRPTVHKFSGFLLDMDGTLIDSTDAIEKHWRQLGKEMNFDAEVLLQTSHGRRSIDTLRILAPERATWEYVSHIEGRIPIDLGASAVEVPGARNMLSALNSVHASWAIVTSGTRALMEGWLKVMSLPPPPVSVVAEDVEAGKPEPACYILGQERIGVPPTERAEPQVLVVEDSPSGIKAGKAAGCSVLALATTHSIKSIREAGADWVVKDLHSLTIRGKDENGQVGIEIADSWVPTP